MDKEMVHLVVGASDDWAYFNLGLGYLVNIAYPFLQWLTNGGLNGNDTSGGGEGQAYSTAYLLLYVVPHVFIYGLPLVSMILYSTVGKLLSTNGDIVKFAILSWARYLGFIWHIIMVIASTA